MIGTINTIALLGKSICSNFKNRGHYATVCRFEKQVNVIETTSGGKRHFYISMLESSKDVEKFTKKFFVNEFQKEIKFLIDTGSDVDCIPTQILIVNSLEVEHYVY